jgi:hypothetical protein
MRVPDGQLPKIKFYIRFILTQDIYKCSVLTSAATAAQKLLDNSSLATRPPAIKGLNYFAKKFNPESATDHQRIARDSPDSLMVSDPGISPHTGVCSLDFFLANEYFVYSYSRNMLQELKKCLIMYFTCT